MSIPVIGKIVKVFVSFFKKHEGVFRDGLEFFLEDGLQRAIAIALEIISQEGFTSGDAFAKKFALRVRMEFFGPHDNWLVLLAGYAFEALKKKAKKDPTAIAGIENNGWLLK